MSPARDLKATISVLVSDRPTRQQTGRFVDLCHRIARTYLCQKQRNRRLNLSLLGLSLDDLAMDCITGLFERDAQGRFTQLTRYFDGLGWQALDDAALLAATRRLVFSAVSDRLFQSYHDVDAALSNLIRSLKRAASATADVTLERRGQTLWIHVETDPTPDAETGLLMPPEFLEAHLTATVRHGTTTGDFLDAAARVLRSQTLYARRYHLTALARVLRSAWVRVQKAEPESPPEPAKLHQEDIARLVERSLAATKAKMRSSYVARGKVGDDLFASYFMAIQDRLTAQFVSHNGKALTNYRALRVYLPDLSRAAYEDQHRTVFEYLSKCTRERLVKQLQREV